MFPKKQNLGQGLGRVHTVYEEMTPEAVRRGGVNESEKEEKSILLGTFKITL